MSAGLGACVDAPTASTETTTITATTSASASGSSSGGDVTGDVTGDDSGSTDAPTSSGSSGGADDPCPELLPAPTDCEPIAEACGNATPLAGAPNGYIAPRLALTADDAWFIVDGLSCAALYRVSKRGGDAHRVRAVEHAFALEADEETVYLLERTLNPEDSATVTALTDGVETVLGEVDRNTMLARTYAGVITWQEAPAPFFSLSSDGMTFIDERPEGMWGAGSVPTYDGEGLYYSWSDSPDGGDLFRALLGLKSGSVEELAENATTRRWPTVAVDAENIFFATGDPSWSVDDWEPVGISRVAVDGGPATPLFPPSKLRIDQVLVDDQDVFFGEIPFDISAVAKQGGTPRHVWHGGERTYAHIDDDHLYFIVRGQAQEIPQPGRDFVVRVAKDSILP